MSSSSSTRADLETVDFEQAADRALDLQLRGDELHPHGKGRAHRLCRRRFDVYRPVVAEAHHLGDAAGIIFVGLDRARGQKTLSVSRLDTDDRYARLTKPPVEPLRQRTSLDPGKFDHTGPLRQPLDERTGLAWNLTLPLHRAVAVDNADCGLGE
jgi:hypothetical protein